MPPAVVFQEPTAECAGAVIGGRDDAELKMLGEGDVGHPLPATAGDFLAKPVAKGGLDLGTAGSSAVLLALLLGLMGYAHVRERRTAAPKDTPVTGVS
ncbi:hypothetical protein [Streptomyces kronopolitis]|uniref:hypothetical protein n=1 Tax=Streptomyces kronopolitis TaxID=1612435 RepID=UPI003D9967B8